MTAASAFLIRSQAAQRHIQFNDDPLERIRYAIQTLRQMNK